MDVKMLRTLVELLEQEIEEGDKLNAVMRGAEHQTVRAQYNKRQAKMKSIVADLKQELED